nr:hypothetical protein [Tanacetum cinerariifolium]
MPPRRISQAAIERLFANRVAALSEGVVGRNVAPEVRKCTYKSFLNCNPHIFSGIEVAVGLSRRFEKLESVFRISNYADENKVKSTTCILQGRALTWCNGYFHSVGIDAAYLTPWTKLKEIMITEYCPRNEVQKMEQELWNLNLMGDDISGYTNCFHELAALYPTMVTPEYNKIARYI